VCGQVGRTAMRRMERVRISRTMSIHRSSKINKQVIFLFLKVRSNGDVLSHRRIWQPKRQSKESVKAPQFRICCHSFEWNDRSTHHDLKLYIMNHRRAFHWYFVRSSSDSPNRESVKLLQVMTPTQQYADTDQNVLASENCGLIQGKAHDCRRKTYICCESVSSSARTIFRVPTKKRPTLSHSSLCDPGLMNKQFT
jgi:hypothetical protein